MPCDYKKTGPSSRKDKVISHNILGKHKKKKEKPEMTKEQAQSFIRKLRRQVKLRKTAEAVARQLVKHAQDNAGPNYPRAMTAGGLAGAGLGGILGSALSPEDEDRMRNVLIAALLGGALGTGGGALGSYLTSPESEPELPSKREGPILV